MVGENSCEEELRDHLGVVLMKEVMSTVLRVKKLSCVSFMTQSKVVPRNYVLISRAFFI